MKTLLAVGVFFCSICGAAGQQAQEIEIGKEYTFKINPQAITPAPGGDVRVVWQKLIDPRLVSIGCNSDEFIANIVCNRHLPVDGKEVRVIYNVNGFAGSCESSPSAMKYEARAICMKKGTEVGPP